MPNILVDPHPEDGGPVTIYSPTGGDIDMGDLRKGAVVSQNPLTDIENKIKSFSTANPLLTLGIVGAAAYFLFIKK